MKLVEDMCPLPEAVQKYPLSLLLPIIFRLRIISSMVVLALHVEVAKGLPLVRLAQHKLLVSVDAVVGV